MLSPDLVRARQVGKELQLIPLRPFEREQLKELALLILRRAQAHIGQTRDEWEESLQSLLSLPAKEKKWALALIKLIEDHCVFESGSPFSPEELRREVFLKSSLFRQRSSIDASFPREHILQEFAQAHQLPIEQIEKTLYSDLRGAHRLCKAPDFSPEIVLNLYEEGQVQAILLRSVHVKIEVSCSQASSYRILFRKIKFLRLLTQIHPLSQGRYQIQIEGPFSMFESTTKYGLQLALFFPTLSLCSHARLQADIRWGKERTPAQFSWEGGLRSKGISPQEETHSDEMETLIKRFTDLGTPWSINQDPEILSLPGWGICIPDLQFTHQQTGEIIYVEMMGYWSRDAVWKRIELVEKGLPYKILFAVSKHLRVSEQALDETVPGMLYVYSQVIQAKVLLDKLNQLATRKVEEKPKISSSLTLFPIE